MRAVLFDMDGTIFDSEKLWDVSLAQLAAHLGGSLTAEQRGAMVGVSLTGTVERMHDWLGIAGSREATESWLLERTAELFAGRMPVKPGARELLRAVRAAGYPTACVTSTHRVLTDAALRNLPAGTFDVVVCGDEVSRNKPDPESYTTAAAQLSVHPADCIAIEDSPTGVASAQGAGCVVVAVPSEVPLPDSPDLVLIASLAGITPEWLAARWRELQRPARGADTAGGSHRTPGRAPDGHTKHTAPRDSAGSPRSASHG